MSVPARETIARLVEEANPNKTEWVRELGPVELGNIVDAVLGIPDAGWDTPADYEANYNKKGALRAASHIIFRFCDRRTRPAPCYDLPAWEKWAPRLLPVMEAAVAPYGYRRGLFPRIMLARLPGGAFIKPHIDGDVTRTRPHKVHVPLSTNPDAVFFVDDRRYHFDVGAAYEVNNAAHHGAANGGTTDRIHLIFEYLDADLQRYADEDVSPEA